MGEDIEETDEEPEKNDFGGKACEWCGGHCLRGDELEECEIKEFEEHKAYKRKKRYDKKKEARKALKQGLLQTEENEFSSKGVFRRKVEEIEEPDEEPEENDFGAKAPGRYFG